MDEVDLDEEDYLDLEEGEEDDEALAQMLLVGAAGGQLDDAALAELFAEEAAFGGSDSLDGSSGGGSLDVDEEGWSE